MTAQIGADGLDLFGDPRPELLTEVTRLHPHPGGYWVDLRPLGFHSTQRLWISDLADGMGVAMATWPAELRDPQARHLYGGGLGSALVAAAIERVDSRAVAPYCVSDIVAKQTVVHESAVDRAA